MALVIFVLIVLGVPAAIIYGVRRSRIAGRTQTLMGRCDMCSQHNALIHVSLHQNTGMLIARRHQTFAANVCGPCGRSQFWKMQLHTMFLGPWGTVSAVITPFFLLNNWYYFLATLTLPNVGSVAKSALAEHRDYALTLLASKDEDTVVSVLVKETNARPEDVRAFVKSLYPEVKAA